MYLAKIKVDVLIVRDRTGLERSRFGSVLELFCSVASPRMRQFRKSGPLSTLGELSKIVQLNREWTQQSSIGSHSKQQNTWADRTHTGVSLNHANNLL